MGLLRDSDYWGNVVNELWRIRPRRDEVLDQSKLSDFLGILCRALSDLRNDPELSTDLKNVDEMRKGSDVPTSNQAEFDSFLREFSRWETGLLIQSGMNHRQAVELIQSMRDLSSGINEEDVTPERMLALLQFAQEMACRRIEETEDVEVQRRALNSIAAVAGGLLAVSADVAVLASSAADPTLITVVAAKIFAGKSVDLGLKGIAGALKEWF